MLCYIGTICSLSVGETVLCFLCLGFLVFFVFQVRVLCTICMFLLDLWVLFRFWVLSSLLDRSCFMLFGLKSLFFSAGQVGYDV